MSSAVLPRSAVPDSVGQAAQTTVLGAHGILLEGARGGTRNGSRTLAPLFVPLIRVPCPKSEAMNASSGLGAATRCALHSAP